MTCSVMSVVPVFGDAAGGCDVPQLGSTTSASAPARALASKRCIPTPRLCVVSPVWTSPVPPAAISRVCIAGPVP